MKMKLNLKTKSKISEKKIIIDCFDKILVSYCDGVSLGCCEECIRSRFINTRKDRTRLRIAETTGLKCDKIFDRLVNSLISLLKEDKRLLDEFSRRKVFIIDKNTLSISWEYVLPVSDCSACGCVLIDSINIAQILGQSVLDDVYGNVDMPFRSKDYKEVAKRVEKFALSKNFGIITTLRDNFDGPFPISVAMLPLENGRDESGTGRTSSLEKSRAIALFEAMERYGGFVPRAKKTIIFESYNALKREGREILDVGRLILNQDSATNSGIYKNGKFRFSYDEAYHWIYGYDLTNEKALLLPEAIAYYGMTFKSEKYRREIISYEVSNGCSVGVTLTESVYGGVLEVVERDAFLTSWYTDRSIRRLVLDKFFMSRKGKFQTEFEKFQNFYSDFRVDIYEISCETRIPVVLMTLTRRRTCIERMNFMCAAAADADVVEAMRKAMHEISSIFVGLQKRFESEYDQIVKKAENMWQVESMDDHSLIWGYYKNLTKINFKYQVKESINVSQYIRSHKKFNCLNEAFKVVLEDLKRNGRDVIFINQTTPEMQLMKIYCCKILIPGLLPMTFGAKNARISRKRINELEKKERRSLGINFVPHPFP